MTDPDYLVGVEEYELAFVEAVLDDGPPDSQTVYKETIDVSERSIAAVAALRGGSDGGSQNLEEVLTEGNDAGGLKITNLADPDDDQDAATKAYVDASGGSGGAPSNADYLVGTANGSLSGEIVVGTSPGGELGGTWASPTVDATHSGSSHAAVQAAAEATAAAALSGHVNDATAAHPASAISVDSTNLDGTGTDLQTVLEELEDAIDTGGGTGAPTDVDYLVGTASGDLSAEIVVGTSPGGELGGTWASPTVDATHSGSSHAAVQAAAEATAQAALDAHTGDTSAAHAGSAIANTPAGGIAATDVQAAINELDTEKQPIDSDLTTIAGLSPTNDDFMQRKAGAWANRTVAQVLTDLAAAGTTFQPLDSDLTAIAGLSPTNDDIVQRKSGAWTNRTMAQLIADLAALGTTFQPLDATLTALAAANWAANNLPIGTGADTLAQTSFAANTFPARASSGNLVAKTITDFGLSLVDDADASAGRTTLGLGTIATVAAPSGTVVGTSDTQTLTNKRVSKRTGTTTSSATPTINTDNVDFYSLTAQAAAITSFTTNLSGTPTEAQTLWIAITDNGTARAITWGASFEASTVALPTTTVISTRLDVGFVWNSVTSKWRCVAVA